MERESCVTTNNWRIWAGFASTSAVGSPGGVLLLALLQPYLTMI